MENKGQITISRLMVNSVLIEQSIANYLNRLFKEKLNVFIHSINVAYLVAEIAYMIGYSNYTDLIKGALLHDIGKLNVPDSILLKTEKLSEEEWLIMKSHTIMGYEMVKNDENLSQLVKDIILHHHEKLDGSGYPSKLNRENLQQEIQIVTVCDIYDALTEQRCYGKEHTMEEALKILVEESVNEKIIHVIRGCADK